MQNNCEQKTRRAKKEKPCGVSTPKLAPGSLEIPGK
jgi:hypothetical protein